MELKLKCLILTLICLSTSWSKRILRKIEFIEDPRKNTSQYDITLTENQNYGAIIGNVGKLFLFWKNYIKFKLKNGLFG